MNGEMEKLLKEYNEKDLTAYASIYPAKLSSWTTREVYIDPASKAGMGVDELKRCHSAIKQIIDADRLSSGEYEKKYGPDVDYDPYIIAYKALGELE